MSASMTFATPMHFSNRNSPARIYIRQLSASNQIGECDQRKRSDTFLGAYFALRTSHFKCWWMDGWMDRRITNNNNYILINHKIDAGICRTNKNFQRSVWDTFGHYVETYLSRTRKHAHSRPMWWYVQCILDRPRRAENGMAVAWQLGYTRHTQRPKKARKTLDVHRVDNDDNINRTEPIRNRRMAMR